MLSLGLLKSPEENNNSEVDNLEKITLMFLYNAIQFALEKKAYASNNLIDIKIVEYI